MHKDHLVLVQSTGLISFLTVVVPGTVVTVVRVCMSSWFPTHEAVQSDNSAHIQSTGRKYLSSIYSVVVVVSGSDVVVKGSVVVVGTLVVVVGISVVVVGTSDVVAGASVIVVGASGVVVGTSVVVVGASDVVVGTSVVVVGTSDVVVGTSVVVVNAVVVAGVVVVVLASINENRFELNIGNNKIEKSLFP